MDPAQTTASVAVIFVNANGEVLLHRRDDKPDIAWPNLWGLIAGGIEPGESVEEALQREVKEEIGIALAEHTFITTVDGARGPLDVFCASLDTSADQLLLKEGQRVEFFRPKAIFDRQLVPWLGEMLPSFLASDAYKKTWLSAKPMNGVPSPAASVAVIFVNSKGELLLHLRDDKPHIANPNLWGIIAGRLEAGETVEEALLREVEEEIGLQLQQYAFFTTVVESTGPLHVYSALLEEEAEQLHLTEGQKIAFFTPTAAFEQRLAPVLAELLPSFLASDLYKQTQMLSKN